MIDTPPIAQQEPTADQVTIMLTSRLQAIYAKEGSLVQKENWTRDGRRLAHRLRFCVIEEERPRRRITHTRFGLLAVPVLKALFPSNFYGIDRGDGADPQEDAGSGHGEDVSRTRAARGRFKVGPADDGVVSDVMCVCWDSCGVIGYWGRHGPRAAAGRAGCLPQPIAATSAYVVFITATSGLAQVWIMGLVIVGA